MTREASSSSREEGNNFHSLPTEQGRVYLPATRATRSVIHVPFEEASTDTTVAEHRRVTSNAE